MKWDGDKLTYDKSATAPRYILSEDMYYFPNGKSSKTTVALVSNRTKCFALFNYEKNTWTQAVQLRNPLSNSYFGTRHFWGDTFVFPQSGGKIAIFDVSKMFDGQRACLRTFTITLRIT
jgi:hypothetical protein